MSTWKQYIGSEKSGRALVSALAALGLALGTAAAAPPRPTDPDEKGATRLMDRPAPERLPSETNSPVLAPLAAAWQRLSPELLRYPTVRSNHTVNLAVHVIRPAPGKPVLVFIHGVLSDYLTWEYVAATLAADYELWLVDLPGCGDSDIPKPSTLEPDGYSPTAMGERVWQALQQCFAVEAGAAPRPVTLVAHSLGGTVAIRMLGTPDLQVRYAAELRRIDRAVLFAPADLAINAVPPSFLTLLGLKGWMLSVGNGLGVLDGKVRELTKASYQVTECATIERQRHFAHILKDGRHRAAAQAMLRQFTPFDPKTLRPVWPGIEPLVAEYKNIRVPVLIVHGARDETLASAMGHQIKDQIPGAVLVKLPRRGHSLATEDPQRCANLIQRFQQGQTPGELAAGLEGGEVFPSAVIVAPDQKAAPPAPPR